MTYQIRFIHLKIFSLIAFLWISNAFLVGCAFDLATIKPTPTEIMPCETNCETFTVTEDVVLDNISCGYSRTIKKNSKWIHTGDIPEGPVFKPVNTCFTIECSNVFEAYLVLNNKWVKGFYLPVEKGYVPIKEPAQLLMK